MDTLSLRIDREPLKYVSKIFPLPHLRGVLCGTGSLNTVMDWHAYIQGQVIGNTMDIANKIAPSQLKSIHSKYDLNGTNEATIYHFGFNPREEGGRIRGFAFRSTKNFLPEKLNDGIGIKPNDDENFLEKCEEEYFEEGIYEKIKLQLRQGYLWSEIKENYDDSFNAIKNIYDINNIDIENKIDKIISEIVIEKMAE